MQDQLTLSSGNTYIQFSFEKSLRKYQKQPHKKIKPNTQCNSHNKHHAGSICKHCVGKINRQNSSQLSERLINFQNTRKNELMISRYKAREFSETKKKRERQSSARKDSSVKKSSEKGVESRSKYHQPLSQFKLDEQINIEFSKDRNQKQSLHEIQNHKPVDDHLQLENKENENSEFEDFDEDSEKIIQEQSQDSSFCNIQIGKNYQESGIKRGNMEEFQQVDKKAEYYCPQPQYAQISYAYFSSCSSIESISERKQENNEPVQNLSPSKQNQQISQNIKIDNLESQNPFELLKLESKEELKKQCRKQYRDRIFYNIKKINEMEQACSECESFSQNIQKELESMENQDNLGQVENQKEKVKSLQTILPHQINENHQEMIDGSNLNQYCSNQQQLEEPTNPSFKRDRKTFETSYEHSTRRKATKINFQIQQNYQCLGRIRISGLGEEKESICLSIRRFSLDKHNNSFVHKSNDIKIDKSKMVDYLISQRPYLEKSREQLIRLLKEIIDSQQQNSITKRLFE